MTAQRSPSPKWICTGCMATYQRWPGAQCRECSAFATSIVSLDDARARGVPLPFSLLGTSRRSGRQRLRSGIAGLDRMLSYEAGAVPGDSVLMAAQPGSGKTTLLMAACGFIARTRRALYITVEQDVAALATLAEKLGVAGRSDLLPLACRTLDAIEDHVRAVHPVFAVVDSANELAKSEGVAVPVIVGRLHALAHETGAALIITSHVNASGLVRGGPEVAHGTDCVLLILGDPRKSRRRTIISDKNRAGDTTLSVEMEMTAHGFVDVDESPRVARRSLGVGCALGLVPGADGKLQVVEVEAMIAPRAGGERRLIASGITRERLATLIAVIERELGAKLDGDVTVRSTNAVEADAAVVAALVGASRGTPWPPSVVFSGVVRLDGTVGASAGDVEGEAQRLGCRWIGRPDQKLIAALDRAHLRAV